MNCTWLFVEAFQGCYKVQSLEDGISDQFLDPFAVSFVFILNYNYNGTSSRLVSICTDVPQFLLPTEKASWMCCMFYYSLHNTPFRNDQIHSQAVLRNTCKYYLHVVMVTPYHSICNAMQLEVVIITMCWCWPLSCSVATRSLKLTHNQPSWVVNRGLGSHTYIWGLFPWSWELHGDGRFPVKKTVALSLSDTATLQSKDLGDIAYTILWCCYHKFP